MWQQAHHRPTRNATASPTACCTDLPVVFWRESVQPLHTVTLHGHQKHVLQA